METAPWRLTEILNSMNEAFAGARPRDQQQLEEAAEHVLATNPTLDELADARQALLDRDHQHWETIAGWEKDESSTTFWKERQMDSASYRARRAEALAIAEARLRASQ